MGTLDKLANRWNSTITQRDPGFDHEHVAYLMRLDRNRKIAAIYLMVSIALFILSVYAFW